MMKVRRSLTAALILLLLTNGLSVPVRAEESTEEVIAEPGSVPVLPSDDILTEGGNTLPAGDTLSADGGVPPADDALSADDSLLTDDDVPPADDSLSADDTMLTDDDAPPADDSLLAGSDDIPDDDILNGGNALPAGDTLSADDALLTDDDVPPADESSSTLYGEALTFHAYVEYTPQGYVVRGRLAEFPPDVSFVQILYSLDDDTYLTGRDNWKVYQYDPGEAPAALLNQICFYDTHEPFDRYLAGKIDRFWLKLRLITENGTFYETQTAVIDRGSAQLVPEGFTLSAWFASSISGMNFRCRRSGRPPVYYGLYRLTIDQNASAKDIQALLPDTLPVEIQILHPQRNEDSAIGTIECPVTWKPLTLPRLTAGESITVSDAVEDIVIPDGTTVSTPLGIFQLSGPLNVDWDEVELVLNITPNGTNAAETPPQVPPNTGGAGGNEGNAGSDNRNDSTPDGQRPNLPQTPSESGENTDNTPPESGAANADSTLSENDAANTDDTLSGNGAGNTNDTLSENDAANADNTLSGNGAENTDGGAQSADLSNAHTGQPETSRNNHAVPAENAGNSDDAAGTNRTTSRNGARITGNADGSDNTASANDAGNADDPADTDGAGSSDNTAATGGAENAGNTTGTDSAGSADISKTPIARTVQTPRKNHSHNGAPSDAGQENAALHQKAAANLFPALILSAACVTVTGVIMINKNTGRKNAGQHHR